MFRLKLLNYIKTNGIKKNYIAEMLNIGRTTLYKKLKGEIDFTNEERKIISQKYDL